MIHKIKENVSYQGSLLLAIFLVYGIFVLNGIFHHYADRFKAVSVKEIQWTKTSGSSDVSFALCNNRKKELIVNVYIAAYSSTFDLSVAKGNPVYDLAGEKQLTVALKARERKVVSEKIVLLPLTTANKLQLTLEMSQNDKERLYNSRTEWIG